MSTARVKEILSWYGSENPGVRANLARMLNHGRLGGTGKMVILPVDQGFEHGPGRSFAPNPPAYDPRYHFQLAIDSGCNAYASLLGFVEAAVDEFPGEIPIILKVNSHDMLFEDEDPEPAVTGSVEDALRLGCAAVGFTIYPGSALANDMYEELREIAIEAKACGLPVVVWAYPRGSGLPKEAETAVDVIAYAVQIACQLGADIVKCKMPSANIGLAEAAKVYKAKRVPVATAAERVRHVVQSAFDGRRIVIFSGGPSKDTSDLLAEVKAIHAGGGFGSIIGRNCFQRPRRQALELLSSVMDIYASKPRAPRRR